MEAVAAHTEGGPANKSAQTHLSNRQALFDSIQRTGCSWFGYETETQCLHGIWSHKMEAFLDFLLEPTTQEFIGAFGVEEFGEPLFTPCADNSCGVEAGGKPAATPAA